MSKKANTASEDGSSQNYELPPRQPEKQILRALRREEVATNCFKIQFNKPLVLQRYEVKFFVEGGRGVKNLSAPGKSGSFNERRRALLVKLFTKMVRSDKKVFRNPLKHVYEPETGMISVEPVFPGKSEGTVDLKLESIDQDTRICLPRSVTALWAEIKHVEEVVVESHQLTLDPNSEKGRLERKLVELVFNQTVVDENDCHVFPQKIFLKKPGDAQQQSQSTISGRVIKEGITKNARLGDFGEKRVGILLQTEIAKSAFYPDKKLVDYLLDHFNVRDFNSLEHLFEGRNARLVSKEVKRLTLITTHLSRNRVFVCDGIDTMPAKKRTFVIEDKDKGTSDDKPGKTVNVIDYMSSKYNIRLNGGNLPCVFHNYRDADGNKCQTFYPLEVLKIVDGQRVPIHKMDAKFQDEMIKATRMNPIDMESATTRMMKESSLTSNNPHAQNFGLPLDSSPVVTSADLLPAPAILFKNNLKCEPEANGALLWRPAPNRKYLISGNCEKWMVVNFGGCAVPGLLKDFVAMLVAKLGDRGFKICPDPEIIKSNRPNDIFQQAKVSRVNFLMVVTRNKFDPFHDELKHFEIASKIVTQHLALDTVNNVVRKNQVITLENIIMKTNEKLGGTNFTAASSKALDLAAKQTAILERQWLGNNRLFIGLEVSHLGPQQKSQSDAPLSVVGLAYNVNEALSLNGHYFYRRFTATAAMDLAKELQKPILEYKKRSDGRKWPTHIFIYRGGVSEGEYTKILSIEKLAVIKCFSMLAKTYSDFPKPGYTFVAAQRNNGFRLFPKKTNGSANARGRNDAQLNLKPGTCITKGITNPFLEQFILISHRAIQGTARPVLFTVLADHDKFGKRIPIDELKYITYTLSHLHNNVLGSISVPSVLHHAAQVVKRGCNNAKIHMFGTTDDLSSEADSSSHQAIKDDTYVQSLTDQLMVSLKTKYWA